MDSYEKTNFSSSHTSPVLFSDDMIQEKVFFSVLEERKLDWSSTKWMEKRKSLFFQFTEHKLKLMAAVHAFNEVQWHSF